MSLNIIIAIKWEKENREEAAPWLTAGWQLWLVISMLVGVDGHVGHSHVGHSHVGYSHVGHSHVGESVFEMM